jgi:hypothetical protein
MYFALVNVKIQAFSQKHFRKELRFQVSPGTICRSGDKPMWHQIGKVFSSSGQVQTLQYRPREVRKSPNMLGDVKRSQGNLS